MKWFLTEGLPTFPVCWDVPLWIYLSKGCLVDVWDSAVCYALEQENYTQKCLILFSRCERGLLLVSFSPPESPHVFAWCIGKGQRGSVSPEPDHPRSFHKVRLSQQSCSVHHSSGSVHTEAGVTQLHRNEASCLNNPFVRVK